jgi:DNA-binding MarR family transcriptional regulator
MMSSRLMVLANLLRRGAILRYQRLTGLSSVEFGLVASLGRRLTMSAARLAEAVGMDEGQISRALASAVSRKLVSRAANPRDSREVLVRLTRSELAAHDAIVAGALERSERLLEGLGYNAALLYWPPDRASRQHACCREGHALKLLASGPAKRRLPRHRLTGRADGSMA